MAATPLGRHFPIGALLDLWPGPETPECRRSSPSRSYDVALIELARILEVDTDVVRPRRRDALEGMGHRARLADDCNVVASSHLGADPGCPAGRSTEGPWVCSGG